MTYSKLLLTSSLLWLGLAADSIYRGNLRFGVGHLVMAVACAGMAYWLSTRRNRGG